MQNMQAVITRCKCKQLNIAKKRKRRILYETIFLDYPFFLFYRCQNKTTYLNKVEGNNYGDSNVKARNKRERRIRMKMGSDEYVR